MRQNVQDFEGLKSTAESLKENMDSVKCTNKKLEKDKANVEDLLRKTLMI